MPWFRLDDSFHHHPKVVQAGNAATGLWVRCGTYSSQYLTDGHVPADIAHAYGRPREIQTLLDCRLWIENGSGFLIPDYLDFNPSKLQVESDRAMARERQRRARDSAAKKRANE